MVHTDPIILPSLQDLQNQKVVIRTRAAVTGLPFTFRTCLSYLHIKKYGKTAGIESAGMSQYTAARFKHTMTSNLSASLK